MSWLDEHVQSYYAWLKAKTHLPDEGNRNGGVISTPFLGLYNDTLEIHAVRRGGKITLSDDGKTLHDLELVGVSFARAGARKQFLAQVLANYGVRESDGELTAQATEANFPQRKHDLLQAMAELNSFYPLAKPAVAGVFKEDVRAYLDEQRIIYTPEFISRGAVGLEFVFDFQIAYQKREIVMKCFNGINKSTLASFLFMWGDIIEARKKLTSKDVSGLAFINDEGKTVKPEYLDALHNKGADSLLWRKRHAAESIAKLKEAA